MTLQAIDEDFRWEPPPPVRSKHADLLAALGRLHEKPGEWARIRYYDTSGSARSIVRNIKRGDYGDGYEATARTDGDGGGSVYARYVGGAA